jgi:hypothetical protein
MRLRELQNMCSEVESTSAAWKCLPSTANDMGLNLRLAHFLDSNVGQGLFVHMMIVGEVHEGRLDWAPGTVFDLVLFAVADTEAEAGTGLDLGALVEVLGDIHSSCFHSAYSQVVVKCIRPAVEEAVAASPPAKRKAANSLSVCELDSWELEEAILMNSWSASGQGVGQHQRYSRKLPLVRSSKHGHTGLDAVLQNALAHSPPYCQSILAVPTSPVLPDPSGRCWDLGTQRQLPTTPRATTPAGNI